MSLEFIVAFCVTVFIASVIPGPAMLLALTHGMQHGARRACASALGNVLVTLVQAGVSIAGVGAVLLASQTLFGIIKWAGAAYLIYVGVSFLRAGAFCIQETGREGEGTPKVPLARLFWQGAMVTAGNPKAIVFFTAVFPQFIHPGRGFAVQCACMLFLLSLIAFSCYMLYALGGRKILTLFSGSRAGKWINRAVGTSFIGAGIGLAASHRS